MATMISAKLAIDMVLSRLDALNYDFGGMSKKDNAMASALDGVADLERGCDLESATTAFLLAAFTLAGSRKAVQAHLDRLTLDGPKLGDQK